MHTQTETAGQIPVSMLDIFTGSQWGFDLLSRCGAVFLCAGPRLVHLHVSYQWFHTIPRIQVAVTHQAPAKAGKRKDFKLVNMDLKYFKNILLKVFYEEAACLSMIVPPPPLPCRSAFIFILFHTRVHSQAHTTHSASHYK